MKLQKLESEILNESKRGFFDFYFDSEEQLARMHLEHSHLINQIIHVFTFPIGEVALTILFSSIFSNSFLLLLIVKLLYCAHVDFFSSLIYGAVQLWVLYLIDSTQGWEFGILLYLISGFIQFMIGHIWSQGRPPKALFNRSDLASVVYPFYEITFGPFLFFVLLFMQFGYQPNRFIKIRNRTTYLEAQKQILSTCGK